MKGKHYFTGTIKILGTHCIKNHASILPHTGSFCVYTAISMVFIHCTGLHCNLQFETLDWGRSVVVTNTLAYYSETKMGAEISFNEQPGNTKGGSVTVLLTSCLTGLESAV
jgi:hypothetical protein